MPNCAVKGCNSNTGYKAKSNLSYYTLPKDPTYFNLWISICKIEATSWKNVRVCSKHFLPGAYKEGFYIKKKMGYPLGRTRVLRDDAMPTEYLLKEEIEEMPISSTEIKIEADYSSIEQCDIEIGTEEVCISDIPDPLKEEYVDWKTKYFAIQEEYDNLLMKMQKLEAENKGLKEMVAKYLTAKENKDFS